MRDKRLDCRCHFTCTWMPHDCARPCVWPACLTDAEHEQLTREVEDPD